MKETALDDLVAKVIAISDSPQSELFVRVVESFYQTIDIRSDKIKGNAFLDAFRQEWNETIPFLDEHSFWPYAEKTRWTDFMLRSGGFLNKVMDRFKNSYFNNISYKQEYYTIDALYVGGEDLFRSNLSYPSKIFAILEHEFGNNIEEEVWKLIFWRAPLKILIFYDWAEEEMTDRRREWLQTKLKKIEQMIEKVKYFHREDNDTEYLFIIGKQTEDKKNPMNWRWASDTQWIPMYL